MKLKQTLNVLSFLIVAVLSGVIDDEIGSLQLLYQNDLTSNTNVISALLLESSKSYNEACATCSLLSESLLTHVPLDIEDQLNYLVHTGQLEINARLFVGVGHNQKRKSTKRDQKCPAYSIADKQVVEIDCDTRLPALCTQSTPPYNASQLEDPTNDRKITVNTHNYNITGFRDARSFRFLSIPYARPPVGSLRFKPPLPYNGSKAIDALRAGKACIQSPSPYGVMFLNQTSEDCLTLNVFSPHLPGRHKSAATKKAVMVWFYGGSYTEGWANLPDYDGGNLASRGDVVIVTVNYRVGALGFLTTDTILNGNQGLQDQIAALQWVQKHITAFGGDPTRVTVFGQSAGAQSVVALLSSSAAQGLYASAISESSLLGVTFVTRHFNSHFITPAVVNATNCTSATEADTIACLRALPAEQFVSQSVTSIVTDASAAAAVEFNGLGEGLATSEPYLPITAASGGPRGVIDDQFQYLIGNGSLPNRVPFMVGTMRNEAGLFIPTAPEFQNPLPINETLYAGILRTGQIVPNRTVEAILSSGLFPLNLSDPDAIRDALVDIVTSFAWQCPWQQVFRLATQKCIFPQLYSYIFDKGVPQAATSPPRCFPGAFPSQQICHTSDISEVFGRSDVINASYNATNSLEFTRYVMDTWISFARTHNPQPSQDYLLARGSAYQSTIQIALEAPFTTYTSAENGSIHHFNLPPSNSGPVYPDRCEMYETSGGYTLNNIDNRL